MLLLPPRRTGADPRGLGDIEPERPVFIFATHRREVAAFNAHCNEWRAQVSVVHEVVPMGRIAMTSESLRQRTLMDLDGTTDPCGPEQRVLVASTSRCQAAMVIEVREDWRERSGAALSEPQER